MTDSSTPQAGFSAGTVLITGASSGIGRELTLVFARQGYDVILLARSQAALEELAATIRKDCGRKADVLSADLSDPAAPRQIVERLRADGRAVDVLVNNAGFGKSGDFYRQDVRACLEMLQVNVMALTELTGLLLPDMVQRQRGRILNVGSVAGFQPGPGMAVYYASKAYVNSFTEALAQELRTCPGVSATALCPGPVATGFAAHAGAEGSLLFRMPSVPAAAVARAGYRAMRKGRVLHVPGWWNRLLILSVRLSPSFAVRRIAQLLNKT